MRPGVLLRHRRGGASAGDDRGSALVEFVVLVPLLLLPLVYLVVVLARLQAGAFAAQAGAASAARAAATSPDAASATGASAEAVALAVADQGFAAGSASTTTTCATSPCLEPGGRITVTVRLQVDLPGVPALVRGAVPASVGVQATSTAVVDRFTPRAPA